MERLDERGLTLRSSGRAPAVRLWPSFHSGPKPSCLRAPLNSNVRRHDAKARGTSPAQRQPHLKESGMRLSLLVFAAFFTGCATTPIPEVTLRSPSPVELAEGQPVTIGRARQFDIISRINGRTYRIMVAAPSTDAGTKHPVLYVLDGNQYFGTAVDAVKQQSTYKVVRPAIVVGIGYVTDDIATIDYERGLDLTSSKDPNWRGQFGGSSNFARVIEQEIKPFVNARFSIDSSQQIIWGHSLAGLFALQTMLTNPVAYATYIFSSPSIWWNNTEVLNVVQTFLPQVQSGQTKMRVLITSAADEQYRGPDPVRLARRMVDNASELAVRLSRLGPDTIEVQRVVFDGELHTTVGPGSLSRALRFALPLK